MSALQLDRPDWQQEAIALSVDDYKASIDAIVDDLDADQGSLEGALSALETRLLTLGDRVLSQCPGGMCPVNLDEV